MKKERFHNSIYAKVRLVLHLFIIVSICLLIGGAMGMSHLSSRNSDEKLTIIKDVTLTLHDTSLKVSLPYEVDALSDREVFTLSFTLNPDAGDLLYVKTVYAPLKVYADNSLIYSFGEDGTYPSFMTDPPTEVAALTLPSSNQLPINITMVYKAPVARSSMLLASPLLGTDTAITSYLLERTGFSLLFSCVQIFLGLLLIFINFLLIPLGTRRTAPLWLGMFSISTGIWIMAENNLTVFFTDSPSLLYLLAFMGLFFLVIPLYHFAMEVMDLKENPLLQIICLLHEIAFGTALFLQLTGWLPFSKSMYFFHVSIPLSICFLSGYILYLGIRNKSSYLRQFFLPFLVLGICSVLEVLNYQVRIINQLSSVFQAGILLFILLSEVLAGRFLRNALLLHQKNRMLRANLDMLEKQSDMQKERVMLLMKNEETIKEQRHDLKHQYAVLNAFCEKKDYTALQEYLGQLSASVPTDCTKQYCKNEAVNAIVSYYISQVQNEGVQTSVQLNFPDKITTLTDNELCVIFGNLLENAMEACQNLKENGNTCQPPFIRLHADIMGDTLYITMDNSFNGQLVLRDGELISHKRNETGVGLLSIRSLADKSGGYADFKAEGNIFLSNIVLKLNLVKTNLTNDPDKSSL